MFHSVNKLSGGRLDETAEEAEDTKSETARRTLHPETYLKFERLHIIGARSEVSVDQSATTERSAVRVLLQSHAVSLAVPAVQALSVAT